MTWQDELIELETRLASGALSAEEYRRARDELLAQSQSSPQQSSEQQGQSEQGSAEQRPSQTGSAHQPPPSQQQQSPQPQSPQPQSPQPQQPRQGEAGPFPPPFQWGQQQAQQQPTQQAPQQQPHQSQPHQQQQPPRQGNDSTQVIRGLGQDGGDRGPNERTQVVRPSDAERTQAVSDPDRTQTVSGLNRPRPSHGRDRLGQGNDSTPSWGRRSDAPSGQSGQSGQSSQSAADDESPWGESPVVAPSNTWMKQGPESFEAEPARRGRMVGAVVAGVLVIALAVVAIIYFSNTGNNTDERANPQKQQPQHTTTTVTTTTPTLEAPPPTSTEPKSDRSALVKPPGKTRGGAGPLKSGELSARQLFAPGVVKALTKAGFRSGLLRTTESKDTVIGLYALTVRNEQAAKDVVSTYADDQINGGIPSTDDGALQGVQVFANDESGGEHFRRAIYVLYDRVVILDVSGDSADTVRDVFGPLLTKQVDHQPPTVRDPK